MLQLSCDSDSSDDDGLGGWYALARLSRHNAHVIRERNVASKKANASFLAVCDDRQAIDALARGERALCINPVWDLQLNSILHKG